MVSAPLLVEGIRIAFLVDVGLAVARVLVAIVIVGGGSTRQRSIPCCIAAASTAEGAA